MMGKIVFYGAISLDGYLATKEDSLQWLFDTPTGEKQLTRLFIKQLIKRLWEEKLIRKQKNC